MRNSARQGTQAGLVAADGSERLQARARAALDLPRWRGEFVTVLRLLRGCLQGPTPRVKENPGSPQVGIKQKGGAKGPLFHVALTGVEPSNVVTGAILSGGESKKVKIRYSRLQSQQICPGIPWNFATRLCVARLVQ